jgi:hypothetical protein
VLDWSGLFIALLGAGVIGIVAGYIASQLALARQDEKLKKLEEKFKELREAIEQLVRLREISGERSATAEAHMGNLERRVGVLESTHVTPELLNLRFTGFENTINARLEAIMNAVERIEKTIRNGNKDEIQ